MFSSHDTSLVDRLYAFVAALPLHHLNKPVPHFLLDVHDAMLPHIETAQLSLEERGWASVSLPPYLSTLQARLAITGLVIALAIFLFAAALPCGESGKTQRHERNVEQQAAVEAKAEDVVGGVSIEKQDIRVAGEVEEVEVEREEKEVKLETQPVPASPMAVSVTSTSIAAAVEKPIAPVPSPPSALPTTTPASPVSQETSANEVDPRSSRSAPPTGNRTSPIRTRSSTSSIPIRVPTTPARSSSYPTAINTAINHNRHVSTPIARTATSPTSPVSAKVVAASYAWVMSEGLEWDDRACSSDETGEHSDNSASYSDDDEDDDKANSSPRSRRSLEDELQAAGYAGAELHGDAHDNSASDNDADDGAPGIKADARGAAQDDKNSSGGALHPRRHSHTSDIEARYEAWKKTRADAVNKAAPASASSSSSSSSSPLRSGIGGIASGMGGIRKTRSHHSRKDSLLESSPNNSPSNTGRSSLAMSTRSMTRHALQRKRGSALKPWARKRKEDFGEWLKKKTTAATTATSMTKE